MQLISHWLFIYFRNIIYLINQKYLIRTTQCGLFLFWSKTIKIFEISIWNMDCDARENRQIGPALYARRKHSNIVGKMAIS